MEQASEKSTYQGGTVSETVARKDVDRWLDYKRVGDRKREDNASAIDGMVAAVQDGQLIISEEGHEIVQNLKFPIGNDGNTKELKFKARLSIKDRNRKLKGTKATDTAEYLVALIAALANTNKAVIEEMDTEDHNIAQNIALFFI